MNRLVVMVMCLSVGCATIKPVALDETHRHSRSSAPLSPAHGPGKAQRITRSTIPIVGYESRDGAYHRFSGFAQPIGDSVVFSRLAPLHGIVAYEPETTHALSASEVTALRAVYPARIRTVLVLGLVAGIGATAIFLATMGGGAEPFLR